MCEGLIGACQTTRHHEEINNAMRRCDSCELRRHSNLHRHLHMLRSALVRQGLRTELLANNTEQLPNVQAYRDDHTVTNCERAQARAHQQEPALGHPTPPPTKKPMPHRNHDPTAPIAAQRSIQNASQNQTLLAPSTHAIRWLASTSHQSQACVSWTRMKSVSWAVHGSQALMLLHPVSLCTNARHLQRCTHDVTACKIACGCFFGWWRLVSFEWVLGGGLLQVV